MVMGESCARRKARGEGARTTFCMGVMRWTARTAGAALQRERIRGCGCSPLRRLTRGPAPQKILIAVPGHPFRARQMALPGTPRARRLARGIDVQDETARLGPVRSVGLGINEPEISDKVLLVVGGQSLGVWGAIGHRRIERRLSHETS